MATSIMDVAHQLRTIITELNDTEDDGICGACVEHYKGLLDQCAIALTSISDQLIMNTDLLEQQLKALEIEE